METDLKKRQAARRERHEDNMKQEAFAADAHEQTLKMRVEQDVEEGIEHEEHAKTVRATVAAATKAKREGGAKNPFTAATTKPDKKK